MAPLAEAEPRITLDPGSYVVQLSDIQPDTITPTIGKDAGTTVNVYRWILQSEEGPLEYMTRRDPSSEKSNMFKALVAFGVPREMMLEVEGSDLIGRQVLAQVSINEAGYNKVDALAPLPRSMTPVSALSQSAPVAAPAQSEPNGQTTPPVAAQTVVTEAAPSSPAAAPTAAAGDDDLPF